MILQLGDTGPLVAFLQANLGIQADGIFGAQTKQVLMVYQKAHGLVVDGIAGPSVMASFQEPQSKVLTKGIDSYRLDAINDWGKIYNAGYLWAYLQATQGVNPVDSKYEGWKKQASKAGLIVGPYHFIRFDQDMKAQMKLFTDRILAVGLDKTDLPPCLDFEYYPESLQPKKSDADIAKFCLEWIAEKTGRKPVIYLSRSLPEELGTPLFLADYPNWIASYSSLLTVPAPWKEWNFWQFSDSGVVPGIANGEDVNYFNGSIQDLKDFISST